MRWLIVAILAMGAGVAQADPCSPCPSRPQYSATQNCQAVSNGTRYFGTVNYVDECGRATCYDYSYVVAACRPVCAPLMPAMPKAVVPDVSQRDVPDLSQRDVRQRDVTQRGVGQWEVPQQRDVRQRDIDRRDRRGVRQRLRDVRGW